MLEREQRAQTSQPQALSDQDIFNNGPRGNDSRSPYDDARTPPRHGIAPEAGVARDLAARSGMAESGVYDRGLHGIPGSGTGAIHPSDAMKAMYDMGDAPSCATCGAIMTRSGSCYRCMSCGSTSGCS